MRIQVNGTAASTGEIETGKIVEAPTSHASSLAAGVSN